MSAACSRARSSRPGLVRGEGLLVPSALLPLPPSAAAATDSTGRERAACPAGARCLAAKVPRGPPGARCRRLASRRGAAEQQTRAAMAEVGGRWAGTATRLATCACDGVAMAW